MNVDDLRMLLDYHYWARDRVFDAVAPLTLEQFTRDLGNSFKSVRDTLVHTYGAEWIWYQRWTGESPTALPDPADFPDLASISAVWIDQEEKIRVVSRWPRTRRDRDGLSLPRDDGPGARLVFRHMLQHVVNHATYHRGQVTTMLRQLGAPAPKSQDLIAFYRERFPAILISPTLNTKTEDTKPVLGP